LCKEGFVFFCPTSVLFVQRMRAVKRFINFSLWLKTIAVKKMIRMTVLFAKVCTLKIYLVH